MEFPRQRKRRFHRAFVMSLSLSTGCAVTPATITRVHAQAAPPTAETQVTSPATDVAPLPDIVVSATRLPTPADQVASSVTVITATDLQQEQRRTVPDALTIVPGLNVVQTGGPGGQTSVFIRGTNSNQVKVLIDGIDASDPSNPNASFDFGQLLTGDIERIEVLRGPQSGLYGADAIGGVISITTKGGSGPPRVTASSEGGSFGTFNQTIGVSGSTSIFNYAFNIIHFKSTDTPVSPSDLLPIGQPGRNNYYDNYTYSTRLGVDLTDNFSINGVARYTDSTLLFTENPPDVSRSSQVDHQLYTRGEAIWKPLGDIFVNTFGLAYSNVWTRNLDPNPAPAIPTFDLGERVKADWRGVWQFFPGQKLIFGLEDENERLETGTFAASNSNKASYVELQSAIGDRLFLAANARHDDNENFGGHDTYRIAPAFLIQETGHEVEGKLWHWLQGPFAERALREFPRVRFLREPQSEAGREQGIRSWLRAAGLQHPVIRLNIFP
jgi:vitamin B12 transporter